MNIILDQIRALHASGVNKPIRDIEAIPPAGSHRRYYRIYHTDGSTCIATWNTDKAENDTFHYFTTVLQACQAPVPVIWATNTDHTLYIQDDAGSRCLLDVLLNEGPTEQVLALYRQAVTQLATLQQCVDQQLDYSRCLAAAAFDQKAILADLLYFKYYFLDPLGISYKKDQLFTELENWSHSDAFKQPTGFMYRDFQGRNIQVNTDKITFIDYQGGMRGPLGYDLASLLWQAKARLSDAWKNTLFETYCEQLNKVSNPPVDPVVLQTSYQQCVLLRMLQTLGAYGFRGLFEKKSHFIQSIPPALKQLSNYLAQHPIPDTYPTLKKVLEAITHEAFQKTFVPIRANEKTPLIVRVQSFSYLQNGYPESNHANGGGFVFDCRGILNPGRITEYKTQSGQDKSVQVFLEEHTRMPAFIQHIKDSVGITIENYIERGFEYLEISFGCTGGQHRSVYAAETIERHIRETYGVKTELHHLNRANWVKTLPSSTQS
ncbi:MAG: phosphotransferase [Ferruginibacter sp.]